MEKTDLTKEEMKYLYITGKNGERVMVEDNALDYLEERLEFFKIPVKAKINDIETEVIALAINMNDVFYWACGDLEFFSFSDIEDIFSKCFDKNGKYNRFGDMKWCCLKRGMRPQHEWIKMIKKEGLWDDEWESIPEREIDFFNPDFDYPEKCKPEA